MTIDKLIVSIRNKLCILDHTGHRKVLLYHIDSDITSFNHRRNHSNISAKLAKFLLNLDLVPEKIPNTNHDYLGDERNGTRRDEDDFVCNFRPDKSFGLWPSPMLPRVLANGNFHIFRNIIRSGPIKRTDVQFTRPIITRWNLRSMCRNNILGWFFHWWKKKHGSIKLRTFLPMP